MLIFCAKNRNRGRDSGVCVCVWGRSVRMRVEARVCVCVDVRTRARYALDGAGAGLSSFAAGFFAAEPSSYGSGSSLKSSYFSLTWYSASFARSCTRKKKRLYTHTKSAALAEMACIGYVLS